MNGYSYIIDQLFYLFFFENVSKIADFKIDRIFFV